MTVFPPWPASIGPGWVGDREELARWIEQCLGAQVPCDGEPLRDMASDVIEVLERYGWISHDEYEEDCQMAEATNATEKGGESMSEETVSNDPTAGDEKTDDGTTGDPSPGGDGKSE